MHDLMASKGLQVVFRLLALSCIQQQVVQQFVLYMLLTQANPGLKDKPLNTVMQHFISALLASVAVQALLCSLIVTAGPLRRHDW
jgi:hypothetical protein